MGLMDIIVEMLNEQEKENGSDNLTTTQLCSQSCSLAHHIGLLDLYTQF